MIINLLRKYYLLWNQKNNGMKSSSKKLKIYQFRIGKIHTKEHVIETPFDKWQYVLRLTVSLVRLPKKIRIKQFQKILYMASMVIYQRRWIYQ